MDLEKRPTVEFLNPLEAHLEKTWSDAQEAWRSVDSYYNLTFELWPQEPAMAKRPTYRPSTGRYIVDHAVDTQMAFKPHVTRPPVGDKEKDKQYADDIEGWVRALLAKVSLQETSLPYKTLAKNLLLYGYAVEEGPIANYQDEPKEPKQRKNETERSWRLRQASYKADQKEWVPIRMRTPHPARVLMDPTEKQPKYAIKQVDHFAHHLYELTHRKRRGVVINSYDGDPDSFEKIPTSEFWSKHWHTLRHKGGELMIAERNVWGYVPFNHGFAGFGQEPTEPSEVNPATMAVGLLHYIRDSLKMQAQAIAGRHHALIMATFRQRATRGDSADIANQLATSDILELEPGELWWLDVPDLQQWVFQANTWVDKDIESGTYARISAGQHEPGVSTVGATAILATNAGRKFVAPMAQEEDMIRTAVRNILRLIDVMGKRVTIAGHTIGPEEIQGDYSIEIAFEVIDPVLQLQARELGIREVSAGLKSRETYWSADARLEDATGERDRILKEEVEKDPQVHALIAQFAARELGLDDLVDTIQAQQRQNGNGATPNPEPLIGPDGQPLAQSMGQTNPGQAVRELRQPLTRQVPKPGFPRISEGGL